MASWESWELGGGIRQVWSWNFEAEFVELLAAAGPGTRLLAIDVEFPGFLREEPRPASREVRYSVMRDNVDSLKPIQLGAAIAAEDGCLLGAWSFNFQFDPRYDLHSPASLNFLCEAGVDFARHSTEGISHEMFGERLAKSPLIRSLSCNWIVFSGFYDWGYILKLVSGKPLPDWIGEFDFALTELCPRRFDLRLALPRGSLSELAAKHGLWHRGFAHTGGSDALLTLELLFHAVSPPDRRAAMAAASQPAWVRGAHKQEDNTSEEIVPMVPQVARLEAWNAPWGNAPPQRWSDWEDWQSSNSNGGKGNGRGGRSGRRPQSQQGPGQYQHEMDPSQLWLAAAWWAMMVGV